MSLGLLSVYVRMLNVIGSAHCPKEKWNQFRILREFLIYIELGFLGGSDGKESTAMQETWVQSLGLKDPLEEGLATHSSILAWRIP